MSLKIYTSNRIERLVDALAITVSTPLSKTFAAEVIVMQSKGMQRWLAMELAKRFGVWANCEYPFPNALVNELFSRVMTVSSSPSIFSKEVMTWRIFEMLPEIITSEPFSLLKSYLSVDDSDLKRFQLAGKIADTFEQYTIYRPDMLHAWQEGNISKPEELWQSLLWKKLTETETGLHRGQMKEAFCSLIRNSPPDKENLPERITVFGVSYLPAYHLEIIAAISEITEVNIFLLSPTREYWADITSSRAISRLSPEQQSSRFEGNPLLASLGWLGREFSHSVIELGSLAEMEFDLYEEPAGNSLLAIMQSDILNLTGAEEGIVRRPVSDDDRSIQIHSCHSQMREIEVLHDNLLYILEQQPDIEPRDILVMTPDIEVYAPYISAVFDTRQDQSIRVPYSIADRRLASEGDVATALIKLLELPGSRITVVQLLDILTLPPVLGCFGLKENDLPIIRNWLEETHINWGLDEADRLRFGLPGYRSNSWRAGIDRLLLGYAMSDDQSSLFNNITPFDDMEGATVEILGKLVDFLEGVSRLLQNLQSPRTLSDWGIQLVDILQNFMAFDDLNSSELFTISKIAEELNALEEQSCYSGNVSFKVFSAWLLSRLDQEQKGLGFMTGGVTFCAMLPMRSIPFKVIAIIGLNDASFPRQNMAPGFDLVSTQPRPGDRSLRNEDRYLFLETLLSARRFLYISFIGQSISDNSEIPPSVLASELLDAIKRGFVTEKGEELEKRLLVRHRLQAFSSDYFSGHKALFSYSRENCIALQEQMGGEQHSQLFMPVAMSEPDEEWRDVSLARLLGFFANPARFFLENRLGIRLKGDEDPLEEREPFEITGLSLYQLQADILKTLIKDEKPELLLPRIHSLGAIPPGIHGDLLFSDIVSDTTRFAEKVKANTRDSEPLNDIDFELALDGYRLHGRLSGLWTKNMLRYRCARIKAKDQITAWIEHLVLNAVKPEQYPCSTTLIMKDKTVSFKKLDNPDFLLNSVLGLYWMGLKSPLPFYPESSLGYASRFAWDPEKAIKKWNDSFIPGIGEIPGEGKNPYFSLCFGQSGEFGSEFDHVSRMLLEPLLLNISQASE